MNINRDFQSCVSAPLEIKTAFSLPDIICALHIIKRENLFVFLLSNILIVINKRFTDLSRFFLIKCSGTNKPTFTCLKATIETLEKFVKYV